jgi:hypothetical protein
MTFPAFMSVSTDDSVADDFGDYVFFVFVKVRGDRIAQLSQLPKEAEILVPPPSVFRIKAVAKFGGKLTITLEQEPCPLTYLSKPASLAGAAVSSGGSPAPVYSASGQALLVAPAPTTSVAATHSLSQLSVPDVALIVSCRGTAFEAYSPAIISNGLGGDVIDMLDVNDLEKLMESMAISTNHRLVLKATFSAWKQNPDKAFEALGTAKVAGRARVLFTSLRMSAGRSRQESRTRGS